MDNATGLNGEPLSVQQREMLGLLGMLEKAVIDGEIGSLAFISVGARGVNVGYNGEDFGNLTLGTELLKGSIMAKLLQPKKSAILRARG
jgi:hypothetical protein